MASVNFGHSKIIFILFVIVLGIIVYTSVFNSDMGNIEITGNFLSSDNDTEEDVEIEANLTLDSLELDGIFDKIILKSTEENKVYIGKNNFNVNNSEIILNQYDGKIILKPQEVILEGDTDKIVMEGKISSEEETDIRLNNFKYKEIEIQGVYLRKFEKTVSGIIKVQQTSSYLENDELLLRKFTGEIVSKGPNSSISFNGEVEGIKSDVIKAGKLGWI